MSGQLIVSILDTSLFCILFKMQRKKGIFERPWMAKLVFIKKEDKKGIFRHPRRTNYFLPKRRTCPPKRGRMIILSLATSVASSTCTTNFELRIRETN